MSKRILVTGATGTVGSELIRQLQRSNRDFSALTSPSGRSAAGVSGVAGDFADPASLRNAFAGFDTLFLLLPLVPNVADLAANAVAAAKAAGVRHIVRLSGAGADAESPVAIRRLQGTMDRMVQDSGLDWTLLRPSFFMQNWLTFQAADIKAGVHYAPRGEGRMSIIDVRDIAAAAGSVLSRPSAHAGRSYTLTGPEALSSAQQVEAISQAIHRQVKYVDVPEAAAEKAMREMGMPASMVELLMSLNHVIKQGWAAGTTADVEALAGHAPRTFQTFVADNLTAWK